VLSPGETVVARLVDDSSVAGGWELLGLPVLAVPSSAANAAAAMRTALGINNTVQGNLFANGEMQVAQCPVLAQSGANSLGWTLGATAKWGKVDCWAVYATGGTITAGSATQDAAASIGTSGTALHISGLSMTGAGKIAIRQRIRAKRARAAKGGAWIAGIKLLHDIGSAKNATVTVNKANAADNFSAVTQILQSAAQAVPDATGTTVSLAVPDMGDCSNGIEVIFELDVGAITAKNIRATDAFNVQGTEVPLVFPHEQLEQALARVQRQACKTFPQATAPAQNAGSGGALFCKVPVASACVQAIWEFPVTMDATPTLTTFSPGDASANWWNVSAGTGSASATSGLSDKRAHFATATGLTVGELWGLHVFAYAGLD